MREIRSGEVDGLVISTFVGFLECVNSIFSFYFGRVIISFRGFDEFFWFFLVLLYVYIFVFMYRFV